MASKRTSPAEQRCGGSDGDSDAGNPERPSKRTHGVPSYPCEFAMGVAAASAQHAERSSSSRGRTGSRAAARPAGSTPSGVCRSAGVDAASAGFRFRFTLEAPASAGDRGACHSWEAWGGDPREDEEGTEEPRKNRSGRGCFASAVIFVLYLSAVASLAVPIYAACGDMLPA